MYLKTGIGTCKISAKSYTGWCGPSAVQRAIQSSSIDDSGLAKLMKGHEKLMNHGSLCCLIEPFES